MALYEPVWLATDGNLDEYDVEDLLACSEIYSSAVWPDECILWDPAFNVSALALTA